MTRHLDATWTATCIVIAPDDPSTSNPSVRHAAPHHPSPAPNVKAAQIHLFRRFLLPSSTDTDESVHNSMMSITLLLVSAASVEEIPAVLRRFPYKFCTLGFTEAGDRGLVLMFCPIW